MKLLRVAGSGALLVAMALLGLDVRGEGGGFPISRGLIAIDLDAPGNLEAVERDHPDHYAKIREILAEGAACPWGKAGAAWMLARYEVRDIHCENFVLTSFPPKRRVRFSLDDVSYTKIVTMVGWR